MKDSTPKLTGYSEGTKILVSVAQQTLTLYHANHPPKVYKISTSRFGLGCEPGSFKTPLGRFRIAEKFGDDAPAWTIFKSRVSTGQQAGSGGDEDLILSRILWLEGLDPDNANTKERYIYIHGTNQEDRIGTAASHGCIRMRNQDILELYNQVPLGTPVKILA